MGERFEFIAAPEDAGTRIDKLLSAQLSDMSRSALQKLTEDGSVLVGGKAVSKNYKLKNGDVITVDIPEPQELKAEPQDIPIDIVYEDDALLVVNKPKGMVVHPAAGNPDGTLVNALLYHCKGRLSSINGVIRPGIVHRIDKFTSGLLMVAKTDKAHNSLAAQIKEHSFTREYNAVCVGRFKEPTGTINEPIGRSKFDRKKMCVTYQNSKEAVTHYEVIEELGQYSLVRFRLETGRTHQIRVHSAFIGHPVLGDDVYGRPYKGIEGQCLHAKKLGFVHPETGEYMEFDSQLPDYFTRILDKLRKG
ncbi:MULTISPECIES: RluA family pseudouridine synthase [Ruminococcus]|uniref:Pseudouridine synthase n=1 Tax=Ruminococcus albus 8 TaxID=246199 RepID=E9SEN3_RUMAL|nr:MULTISPECIES: RluA family pseudouridine synthase [Ruminococcus]MBE6873613.1 RluA family pseudouridine synthase [Ruminococcus albus]EGC02234.1 pseudouridine synthase, RluA family [Ruminococcus albus 8]MBO5559978.1 RluA family pseudouridine synthase [Ruminococcus sp.]MBQ9541619.1 RluA family pseudouridine synthase [Ruminococcus sp.]MBR0530957.1 RluA family pseudouridine synthase [Ruminococcus sp.]